LVLDRLRALFSSRIEVSDVLASLHLELARLMLDKPLWDDVQAVLAANRVERATGVRGSHPSLLTGMVFDETGERLTPTFKIGREGRQLWSLHCIPDGRGRHSEKPLRRHPAIDRGTATAARQSDRVRRSIVMGSAQTHGGRASI
jgi:hypothetical protein